MDKLQRITLAVRDCDAFAESHDIVCVENGVKAPPRLFSPTKYVELLQFDCTDLGAVLTAAAET